MTDVLDFASSPAFFEAKYQKDSDPWRFASSMYELQRYEALVSELGTRRFRHAYEPGCSIGVLTERLAAVCETVEAVDFSPTAAQQARTRCAALPNVQVRCAAVPESVPPSGYDLLVLSEIGYYFEASVWAQVLSALVAVMPAGGTVLAAHWLGESPDHRITGDQVHEVLLAEPLLRMEHAHRTPLLQLNRLVKT